jgi:hypothetical protein
VGHLAHNREKKNACRVVVKKHEGTKPLGIPKHRWEDNIKVDTKHIGWEHVSYIHLAQVEKRGTFF